MNKTLLDLISSMMTQSTKQPSQTHNQSAQHYPPEASFQDESLGNSNNAQGLNLGQLNTILSLLGKDASLANLMSSTKQKGDHQSVSVKDEILL